MCGLFGSTRSALYLTHFKFRSVKNATPEDIAKAEEAR